MYTPPPDKVLHFAAGGLATLAGMATALLAQRLGANAPPAAAGLLVCLLAALAREAFNLRQGGPFSRADIAATLLGAVPVLAAYSLGRWP